MNQKKQIRYMFRKSVFQRDKFACVICGKQDLLLKQNADEMHYISEILDSHHITSRNEMPNGGFVMENGISLCKDICHLRAEEYLQGTTLHSGFSPENLYQRIGSNWTKAVEASKKLK